MPICRPISSLRQNDDSPHEPLSFTSIESLLPTTQECLAFQTFFLFQSKRQAFSFFKPTKLSHSYAIDMLLPQHNCKIQHTASKHIAKQSSSPVIDLLQKLISPLVKRLLCWFSPHKDAPSDAMWAEIHYHQFECRLIEAASKAFCEDSRNQNEEMKQDAKKREIERREIERQAFRLTLLLEQELHSFFK